MYVVQRRKFGERQEALVDRVRYAHGRRKKVASVHDAVAASQNVGCRSSEGRVAVYQSIENQPGRAGRIGYRAGMLPGAVCELDQRLGTTEVFNGAAYPGSPRRLGCKELELE